MKKLITSLLILSSFNAFATNGNGDIGSVGQSSTLNRVLENAASLNEQTKILNKNASLERQQNAYENYDKIVSVSKQACAEKNETSTTFELVLATADAVLEINSSTFLPEKTSRQLKSYSNKLISLASAMTSNNKELRATSFEAFCNSLK